MGTTITGRELTGPHITSYRTFYTFGPDVETSDGAEAMDEGHEEQSYDCEPDDVDRSEGLTAVDLAVEILNNRLYVTEASGYPVLPGSWYLRSDEPDALAPEGAHSEELTAHLHGFTAEQETAVYERLKAADRGIL